MDQAADTPLHLVFRVHGCLYAAPIRLVREIVWLPELTPAPEPPAYVAGLFNLRGTVAPVMDLATLSGSSSRYRVSDHVIVLECEGRLCGVIAGELLDVRHVSPDQVQPAEPFWPRVADEHPLVSSVATQDEAIVMLADLNLLMREYQPASEPAGEGAGDAGNRTEPSEAPGGTLLEDRYFCPQATAEERTVFHERACELAKPGEVQDDAGTIPLAVFVLGGETLGVDVRWVREFAKVRDVTPVPCCPNHVAGAINLRGEIVVLLDLREALGMPRSVGRSPDRVMILQTADTLVGALIDEEVDVIDLKLADFSPSSPGLQTGRQAFVKGTARSGPATLRVLDLPVILASASLVVDQTV